MSKFYFITHDNHDAYFNIASEEFLLKRKGDFFVYLWINAPAVIVGVNQNTMQEVNLGWAEENGVKVVRRLTGGGAVYHDLNNVCWTVIAPYNAEEESYKKFTAPVINYLTKIGIKAEFAGRNDILVDGKKISGNAETVFGNRIMHHGTILFDTDVDALTGALKPNKLKTESKGIKSVRSRVTNVKSHLSGDKTMSAEDFYCGLCAHLGAGLERYDFNKSDLEEINALVKTKYSTYEWNFGYSPKGKNVLEEKFSFGLLTLSFDTGGGVMENVSIHGDFFSIKPVEKFAKSLNGVRFERQALLKAFQNVNEYINGATAEEIVTRLFG